MKIFVNLQILLRKREKFKNREGDRWKFSHKKEEWSPKCEISRKILSGEKEKVGPKAWIFKAVCCQSKAKTKPT